MSSEPAGESIENKTGVGRARSKADDAYLEHLGYKPESRMSSLSCLVSPGRRDDLVKS